jgi:GNAT superfamily N-acetyltransferase
MVATATSASVNLRRFQTADLEGAYRLTRKLRWPHRLDDWTAILKLGNGVVAVADGEVIGTALWWPYGDAFATIGLVIVADEFQGLGLGKRLMNTAMAACEGRSTLLNATTAGLPLYEKLGFAAIGGIEQRQGVPVPGPGLIPGPELGEGDAVELGSSDDLPAVSALDALAAGMGRSALLASLLADGELLLLKKDGALVGYTIVRRFGRGKVIGPVVAPDTTAVRNLVFAAVARHGEDFLRIDVTQDEALCSWLDGIGLTRVDSVVTMVRGTAPERNPAAQVFALASQALG